MEKSKFCDIHFAMNCILCNDPEPVVPGAMTLVAPSALPSVELNPQASTLPLIQNNSIPKSPEAQKVLNAASEYSVVCDAVSQLQIQISELRQAIDVCQEKLTGMQIRKAELRKEFLEVLGEKE